MKYIDVIPTKIVHEGNEALTYHADADIPVGSVVEVGLGKQTGLGLVVGSSPKPAFKTREIIKVIAPAAIPEALIKLMQWLAEYYHVPLAQCVQLLIPTGVTKSRRQSKPAKLNIDPSPIPAALSTEQRAALKALANAKGTVILHGVTGSGKTRVYIEQAKRAVRNGGSAIILVPEIALTSQLVREFSSEFDDLVITHSGLTEAERHKVWDDVVKRPEKRVVLGPRSALFLPVANPGLIVVDEFHEDAYHQDQNPRYHAVRVASQYGQIANAQVILGSATPRVVDYFIAKAKNAPIINLTRPVRSAKRKVNVEIVNLALPDTLHRGSSFSVDLLKAVKDTLSQDQQVLLFHNRRGTATTAICQNCGYVFICPTCGTNLTLHSDIHKLVCHTCGLRIDVPKSCPQCAHHVILFKGFGTKQIYQDAHQFFPSARIARFDSDTAKDKSLHERYQEIINGEVDIIVGTQMVAKGLDIPKLGLVGIMLADSELRLPDFSASERAFQLIHQVSGRVGRHDRQDRIVIQTFNPDHPAIVHGLEQNFADFYEYEVNERQQHGYPPFMYLANLTCAYSSPESALNAAAKLRDKLRTQAPGVRVIGPAPAFLAKRGNKFRYHLVLKAPVRSDLIKALKLVPSNWTADLDPVNLL